MNDLLHQFDDSPVGRHPRGHVKAVACDECGCLREAIHNAHEEIKARAHEQHQRFIRLMLGHSEKAA